MAMFRAPTDFCHRPIVTQRNKEDSTSSHTCDFCSEAWDSDTEVDIHRKTAHKYDLLQILKDKNSYACRVCVKPHKSKEELIRHVKSWHLLSSEDAVRVEREIFICDVCSVVFFNKYMLQVHVRVFHYTCDKIRTYMKCPICVREYRVKNFWFHFQCHRMMSAACCKVCLTKCSGRRDLLRHYETHGRYLFCDVCQYQSKSNYYFREHLAAKHGGKAPAADTKYLPYFMPRTGDNRLKFISDTAVKGLKLPFFDYLMRICVLCREICHGEQHMKEHIRNAHVACEAQRVWLVCSCGQRFNSKVLLKHHILKSGRDHRDAGTINSNTEVLVHAKKSLGDDERLNRDYTISRSIDNVESESIRKIKVEIIDEVKSEAIENVEYESVDNIKEECVDNIEREGVVHAKNECVNNVKVESIDHREYDDNIDNIGYVCIENIKVESIDNVESERA